MLLTELFDSSGKFQKDGSTDDSASYSFEAGGVSYNLEVEQLNRLAKSVYEAASKKFSPEEFDKFKASKFFNVEFMAENVPKDVYGIIGSGNAVAVFNIVSKILSDVVKSFKPDYLLIDALEPSRQKLYRRLFKRFGKGFFETPDQYRKGSITFVVEV